MNKRLILIAYFFPPDGGGGAQRPKSIVDHAAAAGWDVTVVTRRPPDSRSKWEPEDASLVPDNDAVYRVAVPEGSGAGAMVPPPAGEADPWVAAMADRVVELVEAQRPEAILVTMPPYGMSPIVPALKPRVDVPVIVDLRDPWALDGAFQYRTRLAWRKNFSYMQHVLRCADGVIANTPEARQRLHAAVPELPDDRFGMVTNGFDAADFDGPAPPAPEGIEPGRFHLVHTGTFHSEAWARMHGLRGRLRRCYTHRAEPIDVTGRTPLHLLDAMRRLLAEGHPHAEKVRLCQVGVPDDATRRMIEDSGVSHLVNVLGYVPHHESVAWVRHADALFLPLHGLPAGQRALITPGKTYEYLASGRPILGCLPDGDAADLVGRATQGRRADPCDPAQIAAALGAMLDAWHAGLPESDRDPWIAEFDRVSLAQRIFDFVGHVAGVRTSADATQPAAV